MAKRIGPFIALNLKAPDEYHRQLDKYETRRANIREWAIIALGTSYLLILLGYAAYTGTLSQILSKVLIGVLLTAIFTLISIGFKWLTNGKD